MKLDFSELIQPAPRNAQQRQRQQGTAKTTAAQSIIKALEGGGDVCTILLMACDALADATHDEFFRQRAHDALFLLVHDVMKQGGAGFSKRRYEEAFKKYRLLTNSTREHEKLEKLIQAAKWAYKAGQK